MVQRGNTISLRLQVSVSVLYTFYFPYSMLSTIDEFLNMRSFHWILLIIKVDSGIVRIMDSKRKEQKEYKDIVDMLQR